MNSFVKYGLIMIAVGILGSALMPFLAIIFGPISVVGWLLLIFGVVKGFMSRNGYDAFSKGYKYSFSNSGTGIAISPERKIVKLKLKNNVKEYPFSDVRKWETNISSGGHIMGGGTQVLGHNIRTNRKNKVESGLFIKVKDIDNPEWRIAMMNKKEQNRWMEILQQTMNES